MKRLMIFVYVSTILSHAWGSGFFTPTHGVHIQGRGGAGVLSAIDINALWYNPAMLAGLGKFHLTIDLTLLNQNSSFERAPRTLTNGEVIEYPKVDNLAQPLTVPQLGVASHLGTERFVFALGAWAPNGLTSRYSETGPQRYSIIDTEGSFALSIALAMAWRVTDWLWIGGSFQNHIVQIRLVNMVTVWPGFTGDAESQNYDLLFEGVVSSPWSPSGNFGIRIAALPALELGFNVQLPIHIRDPQAVVKQRLPSGVLFDQVKVIGKSVDAYFDHPWIIRTGIRYHQPRWDIELNMVIEFWSIFDAINITPNQIVVENVPGVGSISAGSLSIPRNYQDTVSLRLGSDFKLLPKLLDIRIGGFWEQSAIPAQTLSVLQMDSDKVGLSLGLTWHATQHMLVDLAYTHIFYQDVNVTHSLVRQINPTDQANSIIVGNGLYRLSVDLIGLGIRFDL